MLEGLSDVISLISVVVAGGAVFLSYYTVSKQLRMQLGIRLSELRQERIAQLRNAMVEFHSFGMTPDLEHNREREFYKYGTKIELLLNKDDSDYDALQECMYALLQAQTLAEKYSANPQYIEICQRILKREWEVLKQEIKDA